ncbi:MAG TPA: hypothetical protein PLM98_08980 [Thiolinea sp.]|nr:hypothetical protein [Thiolinea sp.]
MLKNTVVIAVLLIISIATYYLPGYLAAPADGSNQAISSIALVVSTVTFVLAIVGMVQRSKDKSKLN